MMECDSNCDTCELRSLDRELWEILSDEEISSDTCREIFTLLEDRGWIKR